jgi:hypothetical protein
VRKRMKLRIKRKSKRISSVVTDSVCSIMFVVE